jgi:hypothetical protein
MGTCWLSTSNRMLNESTALPFCHLENLWPDYRNDKFSWALPPHQKNELSSRPERSAVEGFAVDSSSIKYK